MTRADPRPDYRSIFISDVHLGSAGCQADALCAFMKTHTSEQLYLVGDIIDGWRMRKKWYWPQSHTNVIRRILTAAKRGTAPIQQDRGSTPNAPGAPIDDGV